MPELFNSLFIAPFDYGFMQQSPQRFRLDAEP